MWGGSIIDMTAGMGSKAPGSSAHLSALLMVLRPSTPVDHSGDQSLAVTASVCSRGAISAFTHTHTFAGQQCRPAGLNTFLIFKTQPKQEHILMNCIH